MRAWHEALEAWTPPASWLRVHALDVHTEGEPLRVVVSGMPPIEGRDILARRAWLGRNHDHLRTALMWEPRGHADMYGCLVTPPVTDEADFGVVFTHNEGYSTMCGHGIIGVVTAMGELGLLPASGEPGAGDGVEARGRRGARSETTVSVGIDTPAGFVRASARREGGRTLDVSFLNVPSFAATLDARVPVDGVGDVRYDLAYGGAFYAYVDASDFGLSLVPSETPRLVDLGRRIKSAVQAAAPPRHPAAPDLSFLYGTIFVGPAHAEGRHSRNVCVFADGEVDRSPTGTGVSGRLAIHHARGDLARDQTIHVESILGTVFSGRVVDETKVGEHPAIVPEVKGRAWVTGRHEFLVDPTDPLRDGFLLR